jgi:hypothetical protein
LVTVWLVSLAEAAALAVVVLAVRPDTRLGPVVNWTFVSAILTGRHKLFGDLVPFTVFAVASYAAAVACTSVVALDDYFFHM